MNGIPPDLTISENVTDRNGRTTTQDKLITDSGGCRMLGLTLKNSQTWDAHLSTGQKAILPTLRRQIGLLSRVGQRMSKAARLKLVNCLVLSRMSYMICIWGNTNRSQTKKAQVVMNMAGRLVTGFPKYTRQQDILDSCGWLCVNDLTEYYTMCQIWKIVRWGAPQYLKEKLETTEDNRLRTRPPRLHMTAETFRCKGVEKWNLLPDYLRDENTLKGFKKNMKKWLKERRTEDNDAEEGLQDNHPDNPPGQGQDY